MRSLLVIMLLLPVAVLIDSAPVFADAPLDLRLLVDVSGSMKENDPNNLRAPATRLLVDLVPEGAHGAMWTFGTRSEELVGPGPIDNLWRQRATSAITRIDSHAAFTNIEQALETAIADWSEGTSTGARNIILLTDGVVDISKRMEMNYASRARILDELLARLQSLGASVHAVALSDNADHELLQALALGTDGRYENIPDAESLHRAFLHMFEQAAPRDTLPLDDNRFVVDASIEEMTLLVFRLPDSPPTRLVPPSGKPMDADSFGDSMRWRTESGYDLITVTQPAPGPWAILADIDPDNRVMVATHLKVRANRLPNNILLGEQFDFQAELLEGDTRVTRKAFLDLVHTRLQLQSDSGEMRVIELTRGGDAVYSAHLPPPLNSGRLELKLIADGTTFQREYRQTMQVYSDPLHITQIPPEAGSRVHEIAIEAIDGLLDVDSLTIETLLSDADGHVLATRSPERANLWRLTVRDLGPGNHSLVLNISARSVQGRHINLSPRPLSLRDPINQALLDAEPGSLGIAEGAPLRLPDSDVPSVDWPRATLLFAAINIAMLTPGAVGFVLWRRRRLASAGVEIEI